MTMRHSTDSGHESGRNPEHRARYAFLKRYRRRVERKRAQAQLRRAYLNSTTVQ